MKLMNKEAPIEPVTRRAQPKKKRPMLVQKSKKTRAAPKPTTAVERTYPRKSRRGTEARAIWIARNT